MSEHRRRRRDRMRYVTWAGWGLLVVLLGGNLATALVNRNGDTPSGFLTPDRLQTAGFWLPMALALAMSLLGLYWSSKAYAHNERSSLLWARRGYVFTLVGSVAIALACFEPELFTRPWFAVLASAVVGGQTFFFGMLALREYRRAASGEGGRRSRREQAPAPAAPPPAARDSAG